MTTPGAQREAANLSPSHWNAVTTRAALSERIGRVLRCAAHAAAPVLSVRFAMMRLFALSDLHVDFEANARWVSALSRDDYRQDVLILAGDLSDSLAQLGACLEQLARRFRQVFFVPGNHDLWVARDDRHADSLDKFADVMRVAEASGASLRAEVVEGVSIVPLLGWYDGSFGTPGPTLRAAWMDFHVCRWPAGWSDADIADFFLGRNVLPDARGSALTVSFSHFLPRIDLMPPTVPPEKRILYPVLGSTRLDGLVRRLGADIHVYGHSHVNRDLCVDGVRYVNNAFGYPQETRIARKALRCIHGETA
jgi:predicted phosphodiesterase